MVEHFRSVRAAQVIAMLVTGDRDASEWVIAMLVTGDRDESDSVIAMPRNLQLALS